ncbi:MAG: GNAT family N-acetyltransferase [Pseudomonadota bacterium]
MPLKIRVARSSDVEVLSELAMRSKAHWGYDPAFMASCRAELTITPDDLCVGHYWVAEKYHRIVGFGGFSLCGTIGEVEHLFVEPSHHGAGIGRALMAALQDGARSVGVDCLTVDSDPNALEFYQHMGFCQIGEVPSASVAGRSLPHLKLDL